MNSSNSLEYLCKCSMGYKGNNCQTPLTQCDLYSPCLNGATCIDVTLKEFKCQCSANYTWSYCEKHINPCIQNPSLCNTGTCINGNKSEPKHFTCVCPATHSGLFCENVVNPCEPNPCKINQGFCQQLALKNNSRSFQCICVNGNFYKSINLFL